MNLIKPNLDLSTDELRHASCHNFYIVDYENTIHNITKGKLQDGSSTNYNVYPVCVGILDKDKKFNFFYKDLVEEYEGELDNYIKSTFGSNIESLFVAANAKHDLHLMYRYHKVIPKYVWDILLIEYIESGQKKKWVSVEDIATKMKLGDKEKEINDYWERGINTDSIPESIIRTRNESDCKLEGNIWWRQSNPKYYGHNDRRLNRLFKQENRYILSLLRMEINGIKIDFNKLHSLKLDTENKIRSIDCEIGDLLDFGSFNLDSNDHISAILFGGIVKRKVPKSGVLTYKLPRLIDPVEGFSVEKEGYFSTNDDHLNSLVFDETNDNHKKAKRFLELYQERTKLQTEIDKYILPFIEHYKNKGWFDNIIHPTFNNTATDTGRLSCKAPNSQNMSSLVKCCVISRY